MVSGVVSNEMSASFAALQKVHLINLFFHTLFVLFLTPKNNDSYLVLVYLNSLVELHVYLPGYYKGASRLWWAGGWVLIPSSLGTGSLMNKNSQKTFYIPEATSCMM